MEEIRLAEAILQKSESLHHAAPAPAAMARRQHIDLQYIAGSCTFDPDGPSESVNARSINAQVFRERGSGGDLSAARVDALDLHFVTRLDTKSRFQQSVPHGVCGLSGKDMLGHGSFTRTVICTSTKALRGSALTPKAARTWRPASPKTRTSRSEAPLITAGESPNPGAALT